MSALRDGLTTHSVVLAPISPDSSAISLSGGFDAIVIVALPDTEPDTVTDPSAVLDGTTRGLYDLLLAAAEVGVRRCLYLSSLRLMANYPVHFAVTEGWQPLPPSDDPALLGCHLGELIAREFSRERHFELLTLRLGYPVVRGGRSLLSGVHGGAAICTDDVVKLVDAALSVEFRDETVITPERYRMYTLVHAQSPVPQARYLMRRAEGLLGFSKGSSV